MNRFVLFAVVIMLFALANSCREPVIEYPISYVVKKNSGDSSLGVNIRYYVRGEYIRDTLRDTNIWIAEWNAKSGEFVSLEAESFDANAAITIEIQSDGAVILEESDFSASHLKNLKLTHTLK